MEALSPIISSGGASLFGQLTNGEYADITVFWGASDAGPQTEDWDNTNALGQLNEGIFWVFASDLEPETSYTYRCFASNSVNMAWSDAETFNTRPAVNDSFLGGGLDGYDENDVPAPLGLPTLNNAMGATNVTAEAAWLNGTLLGAGGDGTTTALVRAYWGANDGGANREGWGNFHDFGIAGEGDLLTAQISSLSSNAIYFYRFYATNEVGEGWAPESAVFKTRCTPVLVAAPPMSGIGRATLWGSLVAGIEADVTVYWGASDPGALAEGWDHTNSLGLLNEGAFQTLADELEDGQTYYYRCQGVNDYGKGWSDVMVFTNHIESSSFLGGSFDGYDKNDVPAPLGAPTLNNAMGATNVTAEAAWLNGTLLGAGGDGTTTALVRAYWGANDGGANREGWGNFHDFGIAGEGDLLTAQISSLSSNAIYFYRFYATNEVGEGWAPESAVFKTRCTPVLVAAPPMSGIGRATLWGSLVAGIEADVTVYWGASDPGALAEGWDHTNSLGLLNEGAFQTLADELEDGQTYYYRCQGVNDYGEGWSDVMVFTSNAKAVLRFQGGSFDGYDHSDEDGYMDGYIGSMFTFR